MANDCARVLVSDTLTASAASKVLVRAVMAASNAAKSDRVANATGADS